MNHFYKKSFLFLPFVIFFLILAVIVFVFGVVIIFLSALSLLSIFISLAMLLEIIPLVASDLAPVSIFFAGVSCAAFAFFILFLIRFFFPKIVSLFSSIFNRYRLVSKIPEKNADLCEINTTTINGLHDDNAKIHNKNIDNKKKGIRLIIISFLLTALSFILMILAQHTAVKVFDFKSTVYRIDTEIPTRKYINFEVTNIPIKIGVYDGKNIKINYVNETDIVIDESNYEIIIKQDPDFSFSLFSKDQLNYHMEILLPDIIYKRITINSISGNIELGYLYTDELNIKSRSGDVFIADTGGKIFIDSISGDIDMSFLELTDSVNIISDSADVNIIMPENQSPHLSFLTESGYYTGDFFRYKYTKYYGDVFMMNGNNPKSFNVTTKSGNLTFLKRILNNEDNYVISDHTLIQ